MAEGARLEIVYTCERIEGSKSLPLCHKWRVTEEAEGDGLLNR